MRIAILAAAFVVVVGVVQVEAQSDVAQVTPEWWLSVGGEYWPLMVDEVNILCSVYDHPASQAREPKQDLSLPAIAQLSRMLDPDVFQPFRFDSDVGVWFVVDSGWFASNSDADFHARTAEDDAWRRRYKGDVDALVLPEVPPLGEDMHLRVFGLNLCRTGKLDPVVFR